MNWSDISVQRYTSLWPYIQAGDVMSVTMELNDIGPDELDDMTLGQVESMVNESKFIFNTLPTVALPITINEERFEPIPFNRIEFGAFIDLEYHIMDYMEHLPRLLSIIYRRPIKNDIWSSDGWEPYGDFNKRLTLFGECRIYEVFGAVAGYLEFRDNIFKNYEGLFSEKEEYDEIDYRSLTPEERKELEQAKRVSKWGYELLLMRLANNDPLRVSQAAGLSVTTALNLLGMMSELKI